MKKLLLIFMIILFVKNNLFASAYDRLKDIADIQNTQFQIRKQVANEHYQTYQLQINNLVENSLIIETSNLTNSLLFYKEKENKDDKSNKVNKR